MSPISKTPSGLRRALLLSSAAAALSLGLVVILGWHANLPSLTHVSPAFVAMRYNTALGFVMAGLALGSLAQGRRGWAAAPAALLLLLGVLTFSQYLTGRALGIDELFLRDYDQMGTISPGRMAPNTAFCFMLLGASLLLATAGSRPWRPLVLSLSASVLMVTGVFSLVGYAAGVTSLSAWGRFAYMAVHTGAGMVILGAGLFAFAWEGHSGSSTPSWLPVPFAVGVLMGTLVVWQSLVTQQRVQLESILRGQSEAFRQEVEADFNTRFLAMVRMARRWEVAERVPTQAEWESDANLYVLHQPGYQAIEWVDAAMKVRWVIPQAGNEAVMGRDFSSDALRRQPYDLARESGQPQVGPVIDLAQGGRGFVACFPLRPQERPGGFLVAVFRLDSWMQVFRDKKWLADFTLAESGRTFFQTRPMEQSALAEAVEQDFVFQGRTWRMKAAPTAGLLMQNRSRVPLAVLAFGSALAVLVALLIRFAQEARIRARRVEEEVHERQKVEALQSIILENSTVGVALVRARAFAWANHRLAEMLALSPEAILGASSRVIYPSDEAYESLGAKAYPVMASGKVAEHEMELVRADGSRFWCRFVGKAVDPARPQEGSVWMFEDVTDRKRTDRLKREFVSTVSHELRTPLTSIRGSLALLSAGVGGELGPEVRAMVDIALSNSVRLAALVNDILDMEKVGSGQLEINLRVLDLAELVREALAQHQGYARSLGVSFRFDQEPDQIQVWADGDRLLQVLGNLMSNAAKFSPAGAEVLLALSQEGPMGRIEVRDSGPGIAPEFRSRIFQPFSQADSTDARSKGGTGLGLSISRALVEAMKGRIGFTSDLGRGSVFSVELPLASEPEPQSGAFPALAD